MLIGRRLFLQCCFFGAVMIVAAVPPAISTAAESSPEETLDFDTDIMPLLADKCFACHGPDASAEVDLRLDSYAGATEDRGGYRAIDPENLAASNLLVRIESESDPMPPADAEKQLTAAEKELLRRWVEGGGKYNQHWAYVPPVKQRSTGGKPLEAASVIDTMVRAKLAEQGLDLAPPADRSILARRAALTLTGLPPEDELLQSFLGDSRPDAYEVYVDRLLGDRRFGEHQARFWLDAVRYGDTHGLHLDNRRGIYPYRDWVVRAMNRNLPLDQFILWQIAGDLIEDPSVESKVATGFVRLNPTTAEGGAIPEEFQAKNNFDRVENFGTVLLGMTLTCARCHTHKYDPITQTEYYRLLAFFNSTAEAPLDGNAYAFGPTLSVPPDQQSWEAWEGLTARGEEEVRAAQESIATGDVRSGDQSGIDWEGLSLLERLKRIADPAGPFAGRKIAESAAALSAELEQVESQFTTTLIATDLPQPRETKVLRRGEYDLAEGDPLVPDVPEIMGRLPAEAPRNRLGLARWLVAADNPLVTRVLVNRLWQSVFGAGLVRTPEDFGVQGDRPTHPELLDYLAVDLRESGWDMKRMLRLMVTSQTFQQSSAIRTDLDDPENRWWGRGPRYRLDAEVLRDLGLWSSNLLDPAMGGEGVKPPQPPGMWSAMAHPASNTKDYVADQGSRLYRRSLYVYWKRTSPHPMMTLFNAPDRESSCVRRTRTSTPLQSLGMFNEVQRVEMGRKLAERLIVQGATESERLELLFQMLACRPPSPQEREACERLRASMHERFSQRVDDAVALVSVGDAPRNADLPPADVAAWTQVCMTVLASDLAILMY